MRFEQLDRGWTRQDNHESVHCAGKGDNSPVFAGPYTHECGWCWLGYGHTQAEHDGLPYPPPVAHRPRDWEVGLP